MDRRIEVALCEDCGGWSRWFIPGAHPWHVRRCTFCGSQKISRCETEEGKNELQGIRHSI